MKRELVNDERKKVGGEKQSKMLTNFRKGSTLERLHNKVPATNSRNPN